MGKFILFVHLYDFTDDVSANFDRVEIVVFVVLVGFPCYDMQLVALISAKYDARFCNDMSLAYELKAVKSYIS